MRRVEDVVEEYDSSDRTGRKKIQLIKWFQKHPGDRFDLAEIHEKMGEELEVGKARTGQILRELEDESILESHGDQRKAYKLSKDILIPVKYRTIAGLRHLGTIIDIQRWGVVGFLIMSTVLWLSLTFPFWFFSGLLLVSPSNRIGPISEYEILVLTFAMTIWLLGFIICTSVAQIVQRWWNS